MNSLYTYYNNVQKMAAYRQAKRMQCGALTAQGGFSTTDPALMQTPFTIQCVFRPTKVTSTLQVAFNTKGDSSNPRVDLNESGNIVIYGGGFILYTKPANLDSIYDIVFVATDSQLSLFVDGTLITSVSYVNTISLYTIGFYFANNKLYFQGDYLLHRHFNYAMSADEVKAIDNNGDPMGYVVPKAERGIDYSVELTGTRTYTWDAENTSYLVIAPASPMYLGRMYKVNITVSNYETGTPFIYDTKYKVPAQNGTYDIVVKNTSAIANRVYIYGGLNNTVRRLTLTVNSVTPVGLLAEYLPQNLMYGRDDKSIATSWLDSAKQLPLSDEYLPPLFQSIGGYDMAANGAPEILYWTYNYDYVGAKLGYQQPIISNSTTKFVSAPISIGTSDFSIEFYGNTYGSYTNKNPSISNQSQPYTYGEGCLLVYQTESGVGGIEWIIFEKPATGADLADSINLRYKPIDPIEKFHFVITRQGTTVKVYINGELKATKEQSEVKDFGDLQLAIANSSDVGFVRVWNKCLSDSEVSQLENSGDPAGYVLPSEMKTGDQRCIAEYLAMNLVPQKYKPTVAARWLDSATVLPDPDGTLRRIWKSVGGYDMEANGNPIILQ